MNTIKNYLNNLGSEGVLKEIGNLKPIVINGGRRFSLENQELLAKGSLSIAEIVKIAKKAVNKLNKEENASEHKKNLALSLATAIAHLDLSGDIELKKAGRWQRFLHIFKAMFTFGHSGRLEKSLDLSKAEQDKIKYEFAKKLYNEEAHKDGVILKHLAEEGNPHAQLLYGAILASNGSTKLGERWMKKSGLDEDAHSRSELEDVIGKDKLSSVFPESKIP